MLSNHDDREKCLDKISQDLDYEARALGLDYSKCHGEGSSAIWKH